MGRGEGYRLKTAREACGLTQMDVVAVSAQMKRPLSQPTLSRYENDHAPVPGKVRDFLLQLYGEKP